eukprot:TRINITY_DN1201_c0_g1_i2.p1 TRINITY_DN1201_c0_g1~~TRINITY_DN1201_c0_g1_i2.p1  ORF type:complete len:119 (+),score=17.68 TRINITY_DN1201_c0_g1_i2:256-612(+)
MEKECASMDTPLVDESLAIKLSTNDDVSSYQVADLQSTDTDSDALAFEVLSAIYAENCGPKCRAMGTIPAICFPPGGPVIGQICNASLWMPYVSGDNNGIGCNNLGQVTAMYVLKALT